MSAGGKGSTQRPTDQKKWSTGYDNIQWTKEEDEEFDRIQDRTSTERTLAKDAGKETLPTTRGWIEDGQDRA